MKPIVYIFVMVVLPLGLYAEVTSSILPPQKRTATLDLARLLLQTTPIESSAESLAAMSPFNPVQPDNKESMQTANVPVAAAPVLSYRELLQNMAEGINPTGMMQLGDRQILLFGQKKIKVGDYLQVTYEGVTYDLEVSAFDRTYFTLRFKNEEINRPIKASAKKR